MAALADSELIEVLDLIRSSDSVELKLTVPMEQQRATFLALGLDPLDAQVRLIHFFETPDLSLQDAGVVVRARRVQRKGDDTVIKLRPVVPEQMPDHLRENPSFVVEVDALPGGHVCSGSYKGVPRKASVLDVAHARAPLSTLFSKEQRAFYAEHAPEGVTIDDLRVLGPIFVLKLKWVPKALRRKMVAELWLYPDNTTLLELSTKCLPGEAFDVAAEARAYLIECGLELAGEQQTKTRKALELLA